MSRSQLEMYMDILGVLDQNGPLKLTLVMHQINVDCWMLRECFDFLTKQGLVEVKIIKKERKVYTISQLGVTVLKQFRELKEVTPIVEVIANEAKNQETYQF
ncbi:MAG TPA: winged helix-turn-helix domain-containing protein [Verrucomicrobiae bacterium]|nr:winged helix-turn-helix domain-containing protein [Verrucomicrobiae bacterium]